MSQRELAMNAGFSSRYVSFIETGRADPTRDAVLVLAEALDVPPRERNRLLDAAGYSHIYRRTSLEASEIAHDAKVICVLGNERRTSSSTRRSRMKAGSDHDARG